ncbi:hypothetical protein CsSME_00031564 [Camellia sinensis var. sinensis]
MVKSMNFMEEQFFQAINTESKDNVSMKSAASQEEDDNAFSILAGESHGPNEEPTLGDFCDSLTEMIFRKNRQELEG